MIYIGFTHVMGFPGDASGKESTCQCRRRKRCWFHLWVGKIPWRRAWQPIPVFLAWRIPRTEGPGRLQSIGLQRVGHNWSDLAHTRTQVIHFCLQSTLGNLCLLRNLPIPFRLSVLLVLNLFIIFSYYPLLSIGLIVMFLFTYLGDLCLSIFFLFFFSGIAETCKEFLLITYVNIYFHLQNSHR